MDKSSLYTPGMRDRSPPSVNPPGDALVYEPAAEGRDVIERLRLYAEQYGVLEATAPVKEGESAPAPSDPQTLILTLEGAFRVSQESGRELLSAEEEYMLAAIRLMVERHLWGPRFFNDTAATMSGAGDGGSISSALGVINTLRATQRLPYGGQVEAAWVVNATHQLREAAGDRYRQSSEIVLSGSVPLLRGAGSVAREDLIQAERELVYAARDFERFRRNYLVEIASDYFDLLQTRDGIRNQRRSLESLKVLERSVRARVEAGRLQAFEVDIAANRVASAEASLLSSLDGFILQLERFKTRLGLPIERRIALADAEIMLPEPEVTEARAAELALLYRLDLQNLRDRLDDSRRGVVIARDNLLPDLNLAGRIGVPTDPGKAEGGVAFSPEDLDYAATLTLSLPLDREVERLGLRSALIGLRQRERAYAQERDNVVVGARAAVRAIDIARRQLDLAELQVGINRRRLQAQELQRDVVNTQAIVDSENDLLAAENERDRARTSLRTSILRYLRDTSILRVEQDGTFRRLPGM